MTPIIGKQLMNNTPQYEIVTKLNQIILCQDVAELNQQLGLLGNNVLKIFKLKDSVMNYNHYLPIKLTKGMKEAAYKRMQELGCNTLSEYLRLLLSADREIQILRTPKTGDKTHI